MQKLTDVVLDKNGRPIQGAVVTLATYPDGLPATIYASDGGPAVPSVKTNSAGRFELYAANGHYSPTITGTGFEPVVLNDIILFDPTDSGLSNLVSVKDSGAKGNGSTDDTAALVKAFQAGGLVWVPPGDYLIAAAGADSGGVDVTIVRSLTVRCHPQARFFTNGVDNDLVRLSVPANGAGLPADGITVEWHGGIIDQRGQKNSTVMPFTVEYPPVNQGASATCDGISIRGEYTENGVVKSGIRYALVSGATFIAGEHWQIAGGDSGIFMGGCKVQRAEKNIFRGSRDVGFYASSDGTAGTLQVKTECHNNEFYSCFHGVASKRSGGDYTVTANYFENCVRAVLWEQLLGPGAKNGAIAHNTFERCGMLIRLQAVTSASIHDNHARNSGALLADGAAPETLAGGDSIVLLGCTGIRIHNNTSVGLNAANANAANYATTRRFLLVDDYTFSGATVHTNNCVFSLNYCDGYRNLATDINGDRNFYDRNVAVNTTTPSLVPTGSTNYSEVKIDPNNVLLFNTPVQVSDGTVAAPGIARKNQPSTGVFFATNKLGVAVAGVERFAASNTGVSWNGSAPIAKPTITGSRGGNAALASVLTQLAAYGLITDSTTA